MSLSLTHWSVWPHFSGSTGTDSWLSVHRSQCTQPPRSFSISTPVTAPYCLYPASPRKLWSHRTLPSGSLRKSHSLCSLAPASLSSQVPFHTKVTRPSLLNLRSRRSCSPGLRLSPHGHLQPVTSSLSAKLYISATPVLPQLSSLRNSTSLIQPLLSP